MIFVSLSVIYKHAIYIIKSYLIENNAGMLILLIAFVDLTKYFSSRKHRLLQKNLYYFTYIEIFCIEFMSH